MFVVGAPVCGRYNGGGAGLALLSTNVGVDSFAKGAVSIFAVLGWVVYVLLV